MDNQRFAQVSSYVEKGQYPSLENQTLTIEQYDVLSGLIKKNISQEDSEVKKIFLDGYLEKVTVEGISESNIKKLENPKAKPNPKANQTRKIPK